MMRALIFILACCAIATTLKCPETSPLTRERVKKSGDVTIARVKSGNEKGDPLEYDLDHKEYIRLSSYDYFYVPEKIKIPKKCGLQLKAGERYVMGYTYSWYYFYDYEYDFVRAERDLTNEERQIIKELSVR